MDYRVNIILDGLVKSLNTLSFVTPANGACPGMIEAGGIQCFQALIDSHQSLSRT